MNKSKFITLAMKFRGNPKGFEAYLKYHYADMYRIVERECETGNEIFAIGSGIAGWALTTACSTVLAMKLLSALYVLTGSAVLALTMYYIIVVGGMVLSVAVGITIYNSAKEFRTEWIAMNRLRKLCKLKLEVA